jgi:hypothetical protein
MLDRETEDIEDEDSGDFTIRASNYLDYNQWLIIFTFYSNFFAMNLKNSENKKFCYVIYYFEWKLTNLSMHYYGPHNII